MKPRPATKPNTLRQVDTHVFVEESAAKVTLLGTVASIEERERAELVVRAMAPRKPLENRLEVDPSLQIVDLELSLQTVDAAMRKTNTLLSGEGDERQHAGEHDYGPDPVRIRQVISYEDTGPDETDAPYFPATDPVITMSGGEVHILGGFASTSLDDLQVALSADGQVGDEALAEAVQLELREDASTTDLLIVVHVCDGIVYLHGRVPDLVDCDNAADVASHVPGVDEIVDLLDVIALDRMAGGLL
jgi:osmotically-inducible protein OsmY